MALSIAYLLMQMPAPSEVFLAVEVNALIRAGVDVKVFCLRSRHEQHSKLLSDQKLAGVPIYFFRWFVLSDISYWLRRSPGILWHVLALMIRTCWRRPGILIKSAAILPKSLSIARIIQQEQLSIVHAAWGHYPAITAYIIERLMPEVQFTLALGAYDRLMQHPMTEIAAQRAACILTQSEASAELIRNHWPRSKRPIFVIRRGIDVETIGSFKKIPRKAQGVIVSVGRLIQAKGHQHVVEAFAKARRILPDSRLLIIGEGEYRSSLERLVGALGLTDCVEFTGHMSHLDLFRTISDASVFALASHGENLPNSVKEAMALGIPVITTPTTGLSELVQDNITGCIVPMENADAIANAMVRIMSDQRFAESLTKKALRCVEEKFDIRRTTERRKMVFTILARTSGSSVIEDEESGWTAEDLAWEQLNRGLST